MNPATGMAHRVKATDVVIVMKSRPRQADMDVAEATFQLSGAGKPPASRQQPTS